MAMPAKKKPRSGTQWSEAQIAERWESIKLRLHPGNKERLVNAAKRAGLSASGLVELWLDEALRK